MKNPYTATPEFDAWGKDTGEGHINIANNWAQVENAIFWGSNTDYGTLSIVEAQELIEVLQAIIADYPKEPTNEEILNELPVGSVVSNDGGTYVKTGDNWFGAESGMNWTVNNNYNWANNYGPLVVKYRGDE